MKTYVGGTGGGAHADAGASTRWQDWNQSQAAGLIASMAAARKKLPPQVLES